MLWPETAKRDPQGQLWIGGVAAGDLAREFGTPLYVFDEATIRAQCRRYAGALAAEHPRGQVAYAGKAGLNWALLQIIREERLALDVVSAGELQLALWAGFPPERIHLHGNNKSQNELALALHAGIGAIVIDNFYEIELLADLTAGRAEPFPVLLRLNPGIDVHTHDYRKTGILDSKFGLSIETGDAARAVERIVELPGLRLEGYHAHIGSQIFEVEPFIATVDTLFDFAAQMRNRFGIVPEEIAPGGGFGIQYEATDADLPAAGYAEAVGKAAASAAARHDFPDPRLTIEPGRSIVGPAGVALYTLGAVKEIPGVRTYLSVDGGMADNIRPALYSAVYSAELVSRPSTGALLPYTIAGKFCESGDVLIDRVELPPFGNGELLAVPAAGAYCLAMASNYNMALRPAVVFVADGVARLVQRRETFEDLVVRDVTA
jgi:diaminopimelate decarboxylase